MMVTAGSSSSCSGTGRISRVSGWVNSNSVGGSRSPRPWGSPTLPSGPMKLPPELRGRSEEHTSELQSLMRISYAVFCLKKKKHKKAKHIGNDSKQTTEQNISNI